MKKGQKNLSLGNEHAHVCPLMCICVAVHTFGSIFVSLRLLVRFYLLVSVEGGAWFELLIRDICDIRRAHDESSPGGSLSGDLCDELKKQSYYPPKNYGVTLIFWENLEIPRLLWNCGLGQQPSLLSSSESIACIGCLTNAVLETMKGVLSLSPAEWPCNRWGMTQNMADKVIAASYTTAKTTHQVSVIIC